MTSRTLFPNIYNRRIDTFNASICLGRSVGRIDGRTSMRVGVDNGAKMAYWLEAAPACVGRKVGWAIGCCSHLNGYNCR